MKDKRARGLAAYANSAAGISAAGGALESSVRGYVKPFAPINYGENPLVWVSPAIPGLMTSGSPVAEVYSPLAANDGYLQGTSANMPTQSAGALVFTTSQYFASAGPYEYIETYTLPDGSGGAPGEGFTCTGAFKLPDGTYLFGNDGREREDIVSTQVASILHCSFNAAAGAFEKIAEVLIADFGATGSVQAIAFDTTDSTLFVTCPTDGTGKVYHIGSPLSAEDFGELIGSFDYVDANALTFDEIENALIIGKSSDKTATWIDRTGTPTGKSISLPLLANNDHFCFDPDNGDEGRLYTQCGANKQPGMISLVDVATKAILERWQVKEVSAIEQMILVSSTAAGIEALVAMDGYFHSAYPFVNGIVHLLLSPRVGLENATTLTFAFAFKATTQASGTSWIFNYGNATGSGIGIAFKLTSTNNQVRVTVQGQEGDGSADDSNIATGIDITANPVIVSAELNFTTSPPVLRVYINGSDNPTSFNLSSITGGLPQMASTINSSPTAGSGCPMTFYGAKAVPLIGYNIRKQLEGEVAWYGGVQSSLPSSHPFKNFQP